MRIRDIIVILLLVLFNFSDLALIKNTVSDDKHPLVIVPGDAGCQAFCKLKSNAREPFLLWINFLYLLFVESLSDLFKLDYDPLTKSFVGNNVCDILFPGWGNTYTIENLDTWAHSSTEYFGPLVNMLRRDSFFVSNKTLRAAPYDFRKSPNQIPEFPQNLKMLIEETYFNAGNRSVVLLGHSLGSLFSLHFLRLQSISWKQKYINSFVSVSAPLGGSIKAFRIEASGDNMGFFFRSHLSFRELERSMTSLAFLLPDPRIWSSEEKIIITPDKNYSAHDYETFFKDINFESGFVMMNDAKRGIDNLQAPEGIDKIYCFHGSDVPTANQIIYRRSSVFRSEFPNQQPDFKFANGDGTVTLRSLEYCKNWPNTIYKQLPGAQHQPIVSDRRLIDFIIDITGAKSSVDKITNN